MGASVMVMAGGTGGHVFPALAVANELRQRGLEVFWLGNPDGFEAGVVPQQGFSLEEVRISGLRGNGLRRWLAAPFQLTRALLQVVRVVLRRRPKLVLGMGGFASGPGGVAAWLLGIPLVIHEQNAIPGMTNRILARFASRIAEAFPASFAARRRARLTGNPVRPEILALAPPAERLAGRMGVLRLLVLGGSLGAQVLNEQVPAALARLAPERRPQVRHQAGRGKDEATVAAYRALAVEAEVSAFVENMAAAYEWADLVICRAGALTVAELAAAGVASILVPYPHAVDDHQTHNAGYLVRGGAALLLPQSELSGERLAQLLQPLLDERARTLAMALAARELALPSATAQVADICEEAMR
ncbi:MAG: undecaprenyldiphospho-muramoylpentapeptide beta-N-acetylglucosaminyltransferase [Gammaproteobacteria bacterium]|nr:undecaprenyldiphospho-muramoylpentapeptide beta-N-acetylglucosaminyltransferase [Gammaproteobacteria bacterium]